MRHVLWLAGASALALNFTSFGVAQAADGAAAPTIEEVIVTATKREVSLQKAPLAISALTGDQLAARGVEGFADIARLVPGVLQSGSAQYSKFTVRGIQSSNTTSSSGEQKPVAVYLDDLPLTSFSVLTPEVSPFDMSRVEVLRGPQGTLFGSGTLAGAVRYVTNKPNAHGFDAAVQADVGATRGDSYRGRLSGMVNLPLIDDRLAVRAVAYSRDEDGYVTNVLLNQKHPDYVKAWGGRIAAKLQVNPDFSLTAMVTNDRVKNGDGSRYTLALGANKSSSIAPYVTNIDLTTYSVSGSYALPFATLESTTTYAEVKTNWILHLNTVAAFPYLVNEQVDGESTMQDLRLVSKGNQHLDYVLGAFYLNQGSFQRDLYGSTDAFAQSLNIGGVVSYPGLNGTGPFPAIHQLDDRKRKSMEAALYGELTWHITDTLNATVGLRETRYKFSDITSGASFNGLANWTAAVAAGGNQVITLPPVAPSILTTGYNTKLTQKYNLSWQRTPDQNYYVMVSQGFRRAHPNSASLRNNGRSVIDPNDPTIIPPAAASDGLWNYEIGAKTRWFDGRLQANVSLYYIDWGPMQVNLVRQSDVQPFVGNAGKSTSKGVEIELQGRPLPSLETGANLTLQRARVTSISALDSLLSGAVDGARLASPNFQLYVYVQKDWDLADGATVFARADVQHVGSYPNTFPNRPGSTLPAANYFVNPSYENVNLSVGWQKDNLKAVLYAENALDSDKLIFVNASTSTTNRALTLRPRTVGLRLDWRY